MSPLYTRMENDAVLGASMGYERPLYFNICQETSYGIPSLIGDVNYNSIYGDVFLMLSFVLG